MDIRQIAPGVWRASTRYVNTYVVDAGTEGVTLVDTGLPAYGDGLEHAIRATGRAIGDVAAIVLTHGHIDHVGAARRLSRDEARVFLHPADAELAGDPSTNRTEGSLLPYLVWPATLAFVAHCVRNGALRPPRPPSTAPLVDGATLDVPGSPRVIHAPGHTAGSCVFEFREHGVAMVGDVLCTVSPLSGRRVRPQLQTRGSNLDCELARSSLDRLRELESQVLLPGHGPPWRDGVDAAIDSASRTGCR